MLQQCPHATRALHLLAEAEGLSGPFSVSQRKRDALPGVIAAEPFVLNSWNRSTARGRGRANMENSTQSAGPRHVATKGSRRRWPYALLGLILIAAVAVGLFALASRLQVSILPTPPQPNGATALYSLAGGGACVRLGDKPTPPYANIRTTHDTFQAHSETSVAVDPENPLHLVGGAKYFPNRARYEFQVGYVTSTDGGCTWQDGGPLPGFPQSYLTSDP